MKKCDCAERIGIKIVTYKMFEELKEFFDLQVEKGIFREVPVEKPFYIGVGSDEVLEWYDDKWYVCNACGTLWGVDYPDFPACGNIRKFEDGVYPEPKSNV